jgi:hypothetical protein
VLLATALIAGTVLVGASVRGHAASPAPTVYAVSPNSGPTQGGTGVTIYGSGFAGATQVKFGAATTNCGGGGFNVVSDSVIFVTSPASAAGTVDVVVVGPGGSSPTGPGDKFTFANPGVAVVNGLSPASGSTAGGTPITMYGTGFATASAVLFGTTPVGVSYVYSDTTLLVLSPAGSAGTVDVTIVNAAGSSLPTASDRFTFVAPGGPVVQAVNPNHGSAAGGGQVVLIGTGFSRAIAVHFGATAIGSIHVYSDGLILVTVPPGAPASTVDVTVTTPSGTSIPSNADRFSYVAATAPVINGVAVNQGPTTGGTFVELIGSGFTGASAVTFGTHQATGVRVFADTVIRATSPAGSAGTVDITVTTPVGTSTPTLADRFTYQAPTTPVIYGISPHSGITTGRTRVSIFGAGLLPGSVVHFGANTGTNVSAFENALDVWSPPGIAGTVDITVTNAAGTSTPGATDKFTYVAPGTPVVRAVDPNRGLASGRTSVRLHGSGFTGATMVSFGANAAPSNSISVFDDTQLFVTSPAGTSGATVDVTVTTPVGTSATSSADHFTYYTPVAPTITAVSPASGPASGGTHVWITGTALSGISAVAFGSSQTFAYPISDTVIEVFNSPPGTNGATVDITVTTPGGTSPVTGADHFTYTAPVTPSVGAVSPSSGSTSGGTTVYITGAGFAGATAVNFGTTMATFYVQPDGTVITATSPAGAAGTVDVTVVTPGGTSATSANDHFAYVASTSPPTVSALSPNTGPSSGGTTVYVTGTNFAGASQVTFGGTSATFVVLGDTLIKATSPSGTAGPPVDVIVTTGSGSSAITAADKFTYVASSPPMVAAVSPAGGPMGTTVYITGTGFTGLTSVSFGPNPATGALAISDSLAQATSPAGTGTVDVTVTTGAGTSATSLKDQYTYGGKGQIFPEVDGVNPNSGPTAGGTNVTIYGFNFTNATAVMFGSTSAQYFGVFSDSRISATSPPGVVGRVDITVTAGPGTSAANAADGFTFFAPTRPVVNGLLPDQGTQSGGTQVTIYGSGFSGATAVRFGTVGTTQFFVSSDTQMSANAPAGSGSVDVTITGPAGTSSTSPADAFTYTPPGPPVVNAVDPTSGTSLGGTSIILSGSGFTGATAVMFGSTPASMVSQFHSDTQLYVISPAGTAGTTVDITVTTPAGTSATSNADKFTFVAPTAPVVNAMSPNRGGTNGGTQIVVYGSGFIGGYSVLFGGTAANRFSVSTFDDRLSVTAPPGSLGTVDVTVVGPGGVSATSPADRFTYYAAPVPSITAVSPSSGPAGTLVYLTGTGFSDVTSVLFGSACVVGFYNYFQFSDTFVTVTAPPGPTGTVDIRVVAPEGTSATTVNDQFTYTPAPVPSVSAVAPATGPSAGGTDVFITGTGLSGASSVTFGSNPARSLFFGYRVVIDDNLIEVLSPAGTNGATVDVQVTTPGGTSAASSADQFMYGPTPAPAVTVVSPNSGPDSGGTQVLITGTGLSAATQISFGATTLNRCGVASGPTFQQQPPQRSLSITREPVAIQVPIHQAKTSQRAAAATAPTVATVLIPSEPVVLNKRVVPATTMPADLPAAPQAAGPPQCFFVIFGFADNLIRVSSPPQGSNPATVDVTVTSPGGTSATNPNDRFTYTATPAPVVTAISPGTGPSGGGSGVYISGSNLTNPSAVHFGSAAALSVVGYDSLVQVISPPQGSNPTTVDVTVTTAGGTSATSTADHYSYGPTPAPAVSAVSPGTGPIGTSVFITGTGFTSANAVNFGTTPAVPSRHSASSAAPLASGPPYGFSVISDNLIRGISPTHPTGQVDVTVASAGGTSGVNASDKYTYTASPTPAVTIIGPNSGPAGTSVYINGSGFTAASAVSFGGTNATSYLILSDALIVATSPAGSGIVDITVTTPGGTSATSPNDQWTFVQPPPAPTVTSIAPNAGPATGGTSVTISGTNLTGATAVGFGALAAAGFTVVNATTITATSPAGSGTVDVTVTTPGGTSAVSAADKFTFGTPTAPIGLQAVAGDTEATLTWTPPPVGTPITSYTVVASPGGATTTVSSVVPAATVTGLTNGTPYTFTVAATNSVGTGPASAPSAAVTPTAVVQGPSIAVLPAMSNGAYGGYLTTAYLQNVGGSAAHIRVQYFNQSGLGAGSGNSVNGLPAGATWTLRTDNGNSLPGTGGDPVQAGSAVIYSDQPLAVFVNEFAPGNSSDATSYSAISLATGVGNTIYAPAIANNAYGGYTTGIGLVNLATTSTSLTITYRDNTGAVAKTQNLSVAAGAYQALYSGDATLGLPNPFAGTATIMSSAGNIAAVVNEVGPGNQFSSYDAVPAGNTTLYAPVALRNAYGGYNTGMGIQNTTGTAGTVNITYYDATGSATVKTFSIPANGYLGVYQGTDIPTAGAYTAKLTSSVAIAAIVNEVAPSSNPAVQQSTAYNTFATGSSSLHLPLVESAGPDGWSTGLGIMNAGSAATTVIVTYYDTRTGASIGTPQSLSLQPNAFWGLYQPAGGLPNGMRASAVVTTAAGGQIAVICNESNATLFMSYTGQ